MRRLAFLLMFLPLVARAQSTVSCTHGETGTCRQATTCGQSDVQAAVNASAANLGGGYVSPTAFTGDGVYVPAGSCSWASPVSWTNKNINVIGANPTITHSSSDAFDVNVSNSGPTAASFHISDFTFNGSTSGDLLNINVSNPNLTAWAGFFRVDHLTYNYSSSGNVFILYGPVFGLFDHLTGTTPANHFEQANFVNSEYNATHGGSPVYTQLMGEYSQRILSAGPGSTNPGGLGSKYMDFIEDSAFTCPGNYSGAVSDSESGGQRMVFRHSATNGTCFNYSHWTRGVEVDGDLMEIYNNVFTGNSNGQYPTRFGSGTGVIFNNTFLGTWSDPTFHVDETRGSGGEVSNGPYFDCDGTRAEDGNAGDASAPGWPCAGQIGTAYLNGSGVRGSPDSLPLIAWNNGTQAGCSTGGACTNSFTIALDGQMGSGNTITRPMANYIKPTAHSVSGPLNGAVDYCQGTTTMPTTCGIYTNSYVPYTYPNRLQVSGGGGTPPPITGFKVGYAN